MLSLGLKNAILFLLIILILHVLIKNAMIEKEKLPKVLKEMYTEKVKETAKKEEIEKKDNVDTKDKTKSKEDNAKDGKTQKETIETTNKEQFQNNDLLSYVYDDDNIDIAKYFKGMDVTKDVTKDIENKLECSILEEVTKTEFPKSTTCDPALKIATDAEAKRIKADCDLKQNGHYLTLKEYEEENMMNGGSIYGDLKGYDSFDASFEEYACSNTI